jgi:hypothetical protein
VFFFCLSFLIDVCSDTVMGLIIIYLIGEFWGVVSKSLINHYLLVCLLWSFRQWFMLITKRLMCC